MPKLSTAQVRALESVSGATARKAPFIPPGGPRVRPFRYIKTHGLVEERNGIAGELWMTETGFAALEAAKSGSK